VYTLQPECCVLFVTASCKEIFLFPQNAQGPIYRARSLGTGVICRSYSYRGVKLTTLVPRLRIMRAVLSLRGHAVAQLVEALCYKSEGRGFDSRWCHWIFF